MRLALNIVDNFHNLTDSELSVFLHAAQFQDGQASVSGLDWRSISCSLGVARSYVFEVFHSLEKKGFIILVHEGYDSWKFEILNNNDVFLPFREKGENARYLNLNYALLYSPEYINLKKNEKRICLRILLLSGFKNPLIRLSYKKLMELTGTTFQTVRKYVTHLKEVFNDALNIESNGISVKNMLEGNGQDMPAQESVFRRRSKPEILTQKTQALVSLCKTKRVKYQINELEKAAALYSQYNDVIPLQKTSEKHLFVLDRILRCIEKKGEIIAAYINTTIYNDLDALKKEPSKIQEETLVHSGYEDAFIPYVYCFNERKMKKRIDELFAGLQKKSVDPAYRAILNITNDNLVQLLTKKTTRFKGVKLTNDQIYTKTTQAFTGGSARGPDVPDEFASFIDEFVQSVLEDKPEQRIRSDKLPAYLKSWLYDAIEKKALPETSRPPTPKRRTSRFANFEQRKWDFDSIEKAERRYLEATLKEAADRRQANYIPQPE